MSLKAWRFERNSPHYHGPAAAGRVPYDYVLIDSRTGITEIGGLCIGPLSDRLVVLSPLNDQGIEMTRRFLEEVGITGVQEPTDARWDAADVAAPSPRTPRLGPKPTLLVASLLPLGEIDAKRQRLQRLETAIGPVAARLSYHPQLALLESVFVRDYPEEGLATEYRALADQVMAIVHDHAVQLAALSQRYWSEEGSRELAATALLRLTPHQPDLGEALLRNLAPTWTPRTDAEFIAADQMFRLLTQPEAADRPIGFDLWGRLLTEWGTQTTDPSLRSRRLQEALAHFSTVGNLEEASPEQRSLALFNRGVAQERFGNSAAAIEDYTASATVPGTSPSRKAKAVVARGLAKGHQNDFVAAAADFAEVLGMPEAPAEEKAKALVNRGILRAKQGDVAGATDDYTAVGSMSDAPATQKARALINRGVLKEQAGDLATAEADFTLVAELPECSPEERARALNERAVVKAKAGNWSGAIIDASAAADVPGTSGASRSRAVFHRGVARGKVGDRQGEAADYDAVIAMPDADVDMKAQAFNYRANLREVDGDTAGQLADYAAAIDLPNVSPPQKARALVNRGNAKYRSGDATGAMADWTAAALPGAPADMQAEALFNQAIELHERGDASAEESRYQAILELATAPEEWHAKALTNRGTLREQSGDLEQAAADYTAALALPNLPPNMRAQALVNRGAVRAREGDRAGAVTDYSAVTDLPGVPPALLVQALVGRSGARDEHADPGEVEADLLAASRVADAPAEAQAVACGNLGWHQYRRGAYTDAIQSLREAVRLDPENPIWRGNLALALLRTGSVTEADEEYRRAAQVATDTTALRSVADDLREALPSIPDAAFARALLHMLEQRCRELEGENT